MPLARPSSLSRVSSVAGDSVSPSRRPASPFSKPIVIVGRLVGRVHRRDRALIDDLRRLPAPGPRAPCPRRRSAAGWRRPRTAPRRACPWRSGSGARSANSSRSLAALEVPLAPRRDDLDVGLERVIGRARSGPGRCPCRWRRGRRRRRRSCGRSRSAAWRSAAGRSRCRAGTGPRRARWRGTSGRRSRGRTPRAGPR